MYILEGNRRVDIAKKTTGQAPVSGTFQLTYLRGRDTDTVPLLFSASAATVQAAITALDASVTVVVTDGTSALPPADVTAGARLWRVTFQNSGYIPDMLVRPANNLLMGNGADIKIYTKGATYGAVPVSVAGNRVTGKFRLALGGHVTDLIGHDASDTTMKHNLEALPNTETVTVTRTGPSLKNEYVWTVTFIANSGSFPVGAGNIDPLTADSTALLGTNSQITIATLQQGSLPIDGTFQLKFTDGVAPVQSTIDLSPRETADGIQRALRGISSIGDVSVSRSTATNGYTWQVTFNNCRASVCNIGDVNMMTSDTTELTGGAGTSVPTITIVEMVKGVGPLQTLLTTDLSGGEPYETLISSLLYGTEYYARVSFHNAISFGHRTLSVPEFVTTKNLPPGAPRPVLLVSSSATTITLAWTPPSINGGETVSGYELWLSEWSDVYRKVYDRPNDATTLTTTLTTTVDNAIESGKRYWFKVRAVNFCTSSDPSAACYGTFSAPVEYTVRPPVVPEPPGSLTRDSTTTINTAAANDGIAVVNWVPPIDNGGSPITGYELYMDDGSGSGWVKQTMQGVFPYGYSQSIGNLKEGVTSGYTVSGLPVNNEIQRIQTMVATPVPEIQSITVIDASGQFALYVNGKTTALLTAGTSAAGATTNAQVKAAIETCGVGTVAVTSTALSTGMTWTVTFSTWQGALATMVIVPDKLTNTVLATACSTQVTRVQAGMSALGEMKRQLENLPSLGVVAVSATAGTNNAMAWDITFLTELGDVPLVKVTSGRLTGGTPKVLVSTMQEGTPGRIVYNGTMTPDALAFTSMNLVPDTLYAYAVVATNAVGDGIGGVPTPAIAVSSGASSFQTVAYGPALVRGMAGIVYEVQSVATNSLAAGTFKLRWSTAGPWIDPINSSLGEVGDLPLLVSDNVVHVLIQEFVKGETNQFGIAPRMASGGVVTYATIPPGFQGQDLFWTELWSSPPSIVDGTHSFVSDGGLTVYDPVVYEIQTITFNGVTGTFNFKLDTSTSHLGGVVATSTIAVNAATLAASTTSDATASQLVETSLETLSNLQTVSVSRVKNTGGGVTSWTYAVTFISNLCDLPLLQLVGDTAFMTSSTLLITTPVMFTEIQKGVCDVQTVTTSASVESSAEIQSIHTWLDDSGTPTAIGGAFTLAFGGAETITVPVTVDAATMKALLESVSTIDDVTVNVMNSNYGAATGLQTWFVTFNEILGSVPDITVASTAALTGYKAQVIVKEVRHMGLSLGGTFVFNFMGDTTFNLPFDIEPLQLKTELENLRVMCEVDVKKEEVFNGNRWTISFTKNLGDLPKLEALPYAYEVQEIETLGGSPTPLEGSFTLNFLGETTGAIPFDASRDVMKATLEALPSLGLMDVTRTDNLDAGNRFKWQVTFRSKLGNIGNLVPDPSRLTGSFPDVVMTELQSGSTQSLTGNYPKLSVFKKQSGFPRYTARYIPTQVRSNYSVAVRQLQPGSLLVLYYDNYWFQDDPVITRVDPQLQFDWSHGAITNYSRDYISIRWFGKLAAPYTDSYVIYVKSSEGVRLWLNHTLYVDTWEQDSSSIGMRGTNENFHVNLVRDAFYDLKIECHEDTGDASLFVAWSSSYLPLQPIPKSALYHGDHILGSPFAIAVTPGATDFPHTTAFGDGLKTATAGIVAQFIIQAKDQHGNNKTTDGDSLDISIAGNVLLAPFEEPLYIGQGQYRVQYLPAVSGTYQLSIKTVDGIDIYCGLGKVNKCGPFRVTISPGATTPHTSQALGNAVTSYGVVDGLIEAVAGQVCRSIIAVTPITTSDPPPSPGVILTVLIPEENGDIAPEVRVSSLQVSFLQPMILLPTDLNGNGGSTITKYLVEWSDKDFSAMQSRVQVISTTSSSSLKVSGAFRLALDTTGCANCRVKSLHSTSAIPFDATALSMTNILQNLPNVGQVSVSHAPYSANNECTWKVTFVSEVGAVPDFTVAQNLLSTENGVVRIQISSLVVNGGQVGNLMSATYCSSTTTVGGVVTLNSVPSECGFVMPTVESPLPYKYLIQGLTPETTYFARVSALNALVLTLAVPTALVVAYGPPVFSGGTPVTGYTIEWDPKPSFDSGTNGDALGQVIRTGGSGGKYRIDKLTTAQWWHVCVYAMNAEIGAGLPELTSPEREMPRQKPLPPRDVMISNGKTLPLGYSLNVQWRAPSDLKDSLTAITAYQVGWYQKALTDPFFGLPVIQVVQTTGTIASGSFTLAYGDGSERFPYRVLPGTLDAVLGQNYVTSTDLTGLLARGDVIVIDGVTYLVATTGTFSSTQLPLADATNFATKTGSTLATTRIAYSGTTKSSIPAKTLWKTIDMSCDITPSAMKEALEMLPTVGIVYVERFQVGAVGDNNFKWDITFSTQVPSPSALPTFTVNERNLVATINNADVSASVTQLDQVPLAFGFATVLATAGASDAGSVPFSYNITQLTNGVPYFVRVAAVNDIGMGDFALSDSSLAPTRAPLALANVKIRTLSAPMMELTYDQIAMSGGEPIDGYRIEYDRCIWEPLSNGGSSVDSYRVEWDVNPAYTSQCGERSEVQTLVSTHTSTPSAGDKYKLLIGTDVIGCIDWQETAANLQLMVRALGGAYANAEVVRFGDGTARWDFGYTYTVTFVNPVTAVTSAFPLNIPLFSIDKMDTNCDSYQGKVLPKRATFGPGLDDKFGQGKIDSANNECSSLLNEPIAKQTITEAVAMASGLSLPAIQLALVTTTTSTPVSGTAAGQTTLLGAHAPVLCDSCMQKLAASTLTITSAALVGVINNDDYFIVEEVLADTIASSSTSPRKCVMKAAAAATTTSIVIDATDATFLNGGCQLPTTFESNAWTLKRFNLRAHVVQDLIAGRDYSVRLVAKNAQGESQAAMA
ncbi:Projectin/twitchin, partial [Globisporangium splendens]